MALIQNIYLPTLVGTTADDLFDAKSSGIDQTLIGGLGNDVYLVNGQREFAIVENAGEGTDTVIIDGVAVSDFPYRLAANVENLVVRVSGDGSEYQGNGLANVITMADSVATGTDNFLDGGLGNDTLAGGFGDDTYFVDSASDVVNENAGAGFDVIVSTAPTYTMSANVEALTLAGSGNINGVGNALDNDLVGNTGNNSLDGGAGNDRISGDAGNDTLLGNTGDDWLDGGAGNDNLQGGAGNDSYLVNSAGDVVAENAASGQDTVILADALTSYTLAANVEDLYLADPDGAPTGKTGIGNGLDNMIMGTEHADSIDGGAGNDVIHGAGGEDVLKGGLGNDTFVVDNADVVVLENAGEGTDTVVSSVDFALGANVENLVLVGGDDLEGWGNGLANLLTGNAGSNLLMGGDGNDTVNGGAGADLMFGGLGNDTYYVDSPAGGEIVYERYGQGIDTVITTGTIGALYMNVENVVMAGAADLQVFGNDLANNIQGNAGNNVLAGGGGADTLAGGLGNDTYYVDDSDAPIVEAVGAGVDTVVLYNYSSITPYVLAANVENLRIEAGDGNKNAKGNTADNVITGNAGNNSLDGDAGNDTINAGGGADVLIGGAGNDLLNGQAGADTMKGGAGDDTYYTTSMSDRVDESTLSGGGGVDTVISNLRVTDLNDHAIFLASGGATGTDVIENITLDFSAVDAVGNALGNVIRGNNSANMLTGGDGNDTYYVDLLDTVVEGVGAASGSDTVILDVGASNAGGNVIAIDMATRYANVENLTLRGTGNYGIIGTNGANVLNGNDGRNTLRGLGGNDTMAGGKGDDSYQVDNIGDKVIENVDEGIDTVFSQVAHVLGLNFENLVLTGAGNLAGTGNALNNRLEGGAGNNNLQGLDGNDVLFGFTGNDTLAGGNGDDSMDGGGQNDSLDGGLGNDTLIGGAGIDSMAGGAGDDLYVVDAAGEVVTEAAGAGNDTISTSVNLTLGAAQSIETLRVSGTVGLALTGNAGDNSLVGGAGDDTLVGGGGNDSFDGSLAGSDSMQGGAGNDRFNFNVHFSLSDEDVIDGGAQGAGGADVVNANLFDTTLAFTATGIEVFNFDVVEMVIDFSHIATTSQTAINVTGENFSATHLGAVHSGALLPTLSLADYHGETTAALHDATGEADRLSFDLARVDTILHTLDIETLRFNVKGTPLGGLNAVALDGSGTGVVEVAGGGRLHLEGLSTAQQVTLDGFSGLVQLGLEDASGESDELHVNVVDAQAAIESSGIEILTIDSGVGTARSGIQLHLSSASLVKAVGESDLSIRSMAAGQFDASGFAGDNLRVVTSNEGGTGFNLSAADVSVTAIGGIGNDAFTFEKVGDVATISNADVVNGGDGHDSVQADIDGLFAGSTGALRLTGIESITLTNAKSGVQGSAAGASIDAANMGSSPFLVNALVLNGTGTIDVDTVTELKNANGTGRTGQFDTVIYNLGRDLDATAYAGDLLVFGANGSGRHEYSVGEGNHNLYGASQTGVSDIFDFGATIFDSLDLVEGFDTGSDLRLGTTDLYGPDGDQLYATLDGLSGAAGQLRIHGVETVSFTLKGANTIDATDMDGIYTVFLSEGAGAGAFTLSNLDAVGTDVVGSGLSAAVEMNVLGGAGNDSLRGGGADDQLAGGAGADFLDGGAGGDLLVGGAGSDLLVGGAGNDALDGGAGFDTADYSAAAGPITITIGDGTAPANDDGGGGVDVLVAIEKLVGGIGDDHLNALFSDSTFDANWLGYSNQGTGAVLPIGDQSYVLVGGAGSDTLKGDATHNGVFVQVDYSYAAGPVYANLAGTGASGTLPDGVFFSTPANTAVDVADMTTDTLVANSIDGIRGSAYDDILVGGSNSKNLTGTLFESFVGGAGNDFIAGSPTAAAGGIFATDFDRADYANDPSRIIATLATGTVRDGWGGVDTLRDINLIRGSAFADQIYGSDTSGTAQDFQAFEGMAGDDVIDGQGGLDRADYRFSPGAVNVNLATGVAQDGWGTVDSLAGIEWVQGSDFADTLTGGAGNDWLTGMAGNDVMDGGAGVNRADYRNEYDKDHDGNGVVVNLSAASVTLSSVTTGTWNGTAVASVTVAAGKALDAWGTTDSLANIQDVRGTVYDDIIVGNAANNYFDSQAGNDTLTGGSGNDIFVFNTAPSASTNLDVITDFTSGGDKLRFDNATFTAIGADGALDPAAFYSAPGAVAGNDGDDRLVYDTTTGDLYYDADGSGAGAAVKVAVLGVVTHPTLVATDIQVV